MMQRSSKRNKRSNNNTNRGSHQVIKLLDRLVTLQNQDTDRMVPDVQDVPRPVKKGQYSTDMIPMSYNAPLITANSTTETSGAIQFQLSQVPGYTNWTQCWDLYRIRFAAVEFVPYGVGVTGTTTTSGALYTAIDYDDTTFQDTTALLQFSTLQVVQAGQFFERVLKPRVAKALYGGTAFTSYGSEEAPWIDCDSATVPHYGIKYSNTISSSAVTNYRPIVTIWVQFRNSN